MPPSSTAAWDASSKSITHAYDEASRLTGITPQTGSAATLAPDALDRSKSRVVGATTDTYGYLGPSTTSYETGSTTKTDALLDVDGSRLAVKTGGTLSWVIFDLHGSIAALCPAGSSSLSDAYRYDAWGQAIGTNPGSATNPWRYRGLLDLSPDANPILSMGARFYSPQLGTFTQEDSVQGQAANPLSMNRYLYAEANPATLIDPDGHAVMTTLSGGCNYDPEDCIATQWTTQTTDRGKDYLATRKASTVADQGRADAGVEAKFVWRHAHTGSGDEVPNNPCEDGSCTRQIDHVVTGVCAAANAGVGVYGSVGACKLGGSGNGYWTLTAEGGFMAGGGLSEGVGGLDTNARDGHDLSAWFDTNGYSGAIAGVGVAHEESYGKFADGSIVCANTTAQFGISVKGSPVEYHKGSSYTWVVSDEWLRAWSSFLAQPTFGW